MPLTTPRELFIHELSDAMSAEQQILKMLPELQKEALNHEVQEALKTHEEETPAAGQEYPGGLPAAR